LRASAVNGIIFTAISTDAALVALKVPHAFSFSFACALFWWRLPLSTSLFLELWASWVRVSIVRWI